MEGAYCLLLRMKHDVGLPSLLQGFPMCPKPSKDYPYHIEFAYVSIPTTPHSPTLLWNSTRVHVAFQLVNDLRLNGSDVELVLSSCISLRW